MDTDQTALCDEDTVLVCRHHAVINNGTYARGSPHGNTEDTIVDAAREYQCCSGPHVAVNAFWGLLFFSMHTRASPSCMLFSFLFVGGGAQESDTGCGLSSSGMSELALFQELHSYSTIHTGHSTVLVPLAVVMGKGRKTRTFMGDNK